MEDKRQRARVQGGWAGPANIRTASRAASGVSNPSNQVLSSIAQSEVRREKLIPSERQFVFKAPQEVVRKVPEPIIIEKQGQYEISALPSGVSRLHLIPGFIDSQEADWMFEQLLQEVPWRQRTHVRKDLTYEEPRLTAWYGELPYTYSQLTLQPNPNWHPLLTMLKDRIEEITKHTFNSLLCNLYRNEKDSVDWHSDDEPALGRNPVIASLSFGATRMFEMRKNPLPMSLHFVDLLMHTLELDGRDPALRPSLLISKADENLERGFFGNSINPVELSAEKSLPSYIFEFFCLIKNLAD